MQFPGVAPPAHFVPPPDSSAADSFTAHASPTAPPVPKQPAAPPSYAAVWAEASRKMAVLMGAEERLARLVILTNLREVELGRERKDSEKRVCKLEAKMVSALERIEQLEMEKAASRRRRRR